MRGHKRFKDGGWRLTVEASKDPITGKRRQRNRTVRAPNTPAGAQAADVELARLIVEVSPGEPAPSAHITVGELLVRWVEHRRRAWEARSPGQPDWTLSVVRKHFIRRVGDVQLGKLRAVDIDHMYSRWRQDGMAESSVRRMHNLLHSALGQAVRWDLIATNPADRIERPQPAKSKRKAPSDDVLRALLDAAHEDYACYLRLAAVTGARRGQLVALRWSDIDLTAGSVLFTRAHARVRGGVAEKTTKADVDYGIALDPETVEALRAHRKRCVQRALAAGASLPPTAYVFARPTAPDGSVAWTPSAASSAFARLRTKVPGAEGIRARDLRHWPATSMFADGFDPVTVAGRGGWSSPTVPMKVYGHPARDQAAAASLAHRLAVAEGTAGVGSGAWHAIDAAAPAERCAAVPPSPCSRGLPVWLAEVLVPVRQASLVRDRRCRQYGPSPWRTTWTGSTTRLTLSRRTGWPTSLGSSDRARCRSSLVRSSH